MADIDTTDPVEPTADGVSEVPGEPPLRIFINYRREDMPFAGTLLSGELERRFGAENIFFDTGTLQPGMPFHEEIKAHLNGTAGAFIALIGPNWQATMDAHRRLNDHDYVVEEIELGLRNGWTIIPMLLNNATLPELARLPRSIRALRDYQAARLRLDSPGGDIDNLTARLEEISEQPARAASDPGPVIMTPPESTASSSVEVPDIQPPGDEHYQELADELDNLVIFLGAGANADDYGGPFQPGAAMLPDDSDLAAYLAARARLTSGRRELAEVAQYARMIRGEPKMFSWLKEILAVDSEPGPVHRYLAHLPTRLEKLGLEKRYQMIVTPKFDVALEQALLKITEPFDVAVYMAPGTEYENRFVHLPWDSAEAVPILAPNEYNEFPILGENGELDRTVIVRINGAVDNLRAGYPWKKNYVITEDHYINYLAGRPAEEVVPAQILAKLRQASCLFLGYAIADWRLRVFLNWIWPGERPSGAIHWAVDSHPGQLEQRFWRRSDVVLYRSRLTDYLRGFDEFLAKNRGKLT